MKISNIRLRRLIRESVQNLTESLALKAHTLKVFGGQKELDKWGDLYSQGGEFKEQAIEIAKSLLGEDGWTLALVHANNGRDMTEEMKLTQLSSGHIQYKDEQRKAAERRKIRKDMGDDNYEKLKALSPEERPYYTGKLPDFDKDYPQNVSHSQKRLDRFGGSGKTGERIDHDEFGHYDSKAIASEKQQRAFLDALDYDEDAFMQPYYNKRGMIANPMDSMSVKMLEEMGADFIYNEIEVYEVHPVEDFDYGSFRVVGGVRFGDESYEVNLTIQPSIIQHDDGTSLTTSDYDLDGPFTIIYDDDYAGAEREFDPSKQSEEEMQNIFLSDLTETYYNRY